MTEESYIQRLAGWLNSVWSGDKRCAICLSNQWRISEEPLELRPYREGGLVIGGAVYPLMSVTCTVCGNTLLFNAIVSKIVTPRNLETPAAGDSTEPASAGTSDDSGEAGVSDQHG
jgi:hypothetical protein